MSDKENRHPNLPSYPLKQHNTSRLAHHNYKSPQEQALDIQLAKMLDRQRTAKQCLKTNVSEDLSTPISKNETLHKYCISPDREEIHYQIAQAASLAIKLSHRKQALMEMDDQQLLNIVIRNLQTALQLSGPST